jgi:hypothetical protein
MKIFNKKSNVQNDCLKKNNLLSVSELLVIRGGNDTVDTSSTRSDGDSGGLI